MPILRMKEIREMSNEEVLQKVSELRSELVKMRTMINAGGAVENPARVSSLRKTIARLLTVINEKNMVTSKQ